MGIDADAARMRFMRLVAAADERIDLALGCLLIAAHAYPGLDPGPALAELDALAGRVDVDVSDEPTALAALHRVLYREAGFSGARHDYHDPRNALLNDVLARRSGIPISLAVVEVEVARRAGIALFGIGFPGHFLVGTPAGRVIDPFEGGRERTPDELRAMLRRGPVTETSRSAPFPMALLRPATNVETLARLLNNLRGMYAGRRDWTSALWAVELLLVLYPAERRIRLDRAMLLGHAGLYRAATRALEEYLAEHRGTPDRDTAERALALFRGRLD